MSYCGKCGNSRTIPETGEPCPDCVDVELEEFEKLSATSSTLFIPEQYRDIVFDVSRIPDDLNNGYRNELTRLQADIVSLRFRNRNMFLSSPPKHAKMVFAYSCMSKLYRQGIDVFPLFDVKEIRKIIGEIDYNKKPEYLKDIEVDAGVLYSSPILFVKLNDEADWSVYETISTLTGRRVRRGNSTIYLCSKSWEWFCANDKNSLMATMIGDGSYNTIENKAFWKAVQ